MIEEEWRNRLRSMSEEELRELSSLVREEVLAREAKHASELRVGDIIEFEDRAGITRRGHVARISARSVTVHCTTPEGQAGSENYGSTWRVSPSLLRRIVSSGHSAGSGQEHYER